MEDRNCLVACFVRALTFSQIMPPPCTLEEFFAMNDAAKNAVMLPWLAAKQTTHAAQVTAMQEEATHIADRIVEITP